MSGRAKISTYREFWPFYLSEHAHPANRGLHFAGTTLALVFIVVSIATLNAGFLLVALFIGYGFAWAGHFFVEKNRPATFEYPLWSLVSDWRMWFLMLLHRTLR